MDSLTMTETEEKIKASAAQTTENAPQTEQKVPEKETEKKEEAEEEEEFVEEIIESSGTFYDEAEDVVAHKEEENSQDEQAEEVEEHEEVEEPHFANEEYLKSFENRTIDDILRKEREKEEAKEQAQTVEQKEPEKKDTRSLKEYFADLRRARNQEAQSEEEQNKEEVVEEPENKVQEETSGVIEKPNYDLLQTDKKIIKITQKKKKKDRKKAKKTVSIALAIALAFTGGICIVNTVLIDQQYSAYVEIGDTYELNLSKYLKNISNLDATKKSMEVIETYPEEVNEAGDLGEVSNWFDRICNFLSGLFGG